MVVDLKSEALRFHAKYRGKIGTKVLTPIRNKKDLALAYTPGVGFVSQAVAKNKSLVYDYTLRGHTVAIVTDGSAVLGLGNIGPEGAIPVMEGKAALFKTFANLDAFPICLATQDVNEIVQTVKLLAPVFGAVNLEDIAAPRCFEVEGQLQDLGIPVMHDDQHGTATVVLAGLWNAVKVAGKNMAELKVVVSGAGAAGQAVTKMISNLVGDIIVLDSRGIINRQRTDMDEYKNKLARLTNKNNCQGDLETALSDADIFIGLSKPEVMKPPMIKRMTERPIIFALANPVPEIMPDAAKKAGAYIVATGRSDFPNQINNSLAFPGIFKGALAAKAQRITLEMKQAAAKAIAEMVAIPTVNKIIPGPFERGLTIKVAEAVARAAYLK